jgi:DNA polymerase
MSLQLDARRRAMLGAMGIATDYLPDRFDANPAAEMAFVEAPANPEVAAREGSDSAGLDLPADMPPVVVGAVVPAAARLARADIEGLPWDALREAVTGCRACDLCATRRHALFGEGDPQPDWLIVGEPPAEDEDAAGTPFVGEPGRLLDNMLRAVGVSRTSKAFVTSVLRCRPPGNRAPTPQELAQCEPLLRRQVQLLQPKVIVAMGRFAMRTLLGSDEPLGRLRGRSHTYQGIPVVVTYRPQYLLGKPEEKAKVWADLCLARSLVRAHQMH